MRIRQLALIALLGGALMAVGCGDSDGNGGNGGNGGDGGVGGDGGAGGTGGGAFSCDGESFDQQALYDVSCTLQLDLLGEDPLEVDLVAEVFGAADGDLVADEATDVTTCAEVALPQDLIDIIGGFSPEITDGSEAVLSVTNATPEEIVHPIPAGLVESPIVAPVVTTAVTAASAGDVVIEPDNSVIGISVLTLSLELEIPGTVSGDGYTATCGAFTLQDDSDAITFAAE